jgi:hypothetical protein
VITDTPTSAAWFGDSLLLMTASHAIMLKPNGELAWQVGVANLPALDAADDGPPAPLVAAPEPPPDIPHGRRFGRGFFRVRAIAQPVAVDQPHAEMITHTRIGGDRLIFATSAGRVAAVDLNGKIAWQTRPSSRPIDRLLANDDFVVFSSGDELSVQLCAVDIANGQTLFRRNFTREGQWPINVDLSPDGKIVFLTQDQLCAKDLFEPGDKLSFAISGVRRDNGRPAFEGALLPDQLLITQGKILVVAENGEFIHLHSLDTGRPITSTTPDGQEFDGRLATEARDWRVLLQSAGDHVYAIGQRATLVAYNIDHPGDTWDRFSERDGNWQTRDAIIGKNHVLVLDEPTERQADRASTLLRMNFFSRALSKQGRESGLNEFSVDLSDPTGVKQWQAVDGGLYYLTGDGKLHFLRGAGKG